jgi:hypothetical protein
MQKCLIDRPNVYIPMQHVPSNAIAILIQMNSYCDILVTNFNPGKAVGIMTMTSRPEGYVTISPELPDRLCGPLLLLSSGFQRLLRL